MCQYIYPFLSSYETMSLYQYIIYIWAVAKIQLLQNGISFYPSVQRSPSVFHVFHTSVFQTVLALSVSRDFGCRAPFWKPCTFACVPARLHSVCFRPSVAARYSSRWNGLHVSTSGWMVFLILRLTRGFHFLPGQSTCCKFQKCFKQSCKNGLVLMRQPLRKWKNRQIAFVFCFGLPSVWESSTKLIIHRSHSCNFSITLIRAYWRQTATLPISRRPLPLNEESSRA